MKAHEPFPPRQKCNVIAFIFWQSPFTWPAVIAIVHRACPGQRVSSLRGSVGQDGGWEMGGQTEYGDWFMVTGCHSVAGDL